MQFKENQPIYQQIAEFISEKILLEEWKKEERVPSVRELAVQLEVNPNTVMRTYEYLQQQQIIFNQRGIGYFVAPQAIQAIKSIRKKEFIQQELPAFFRTMYLLGMEPADLTTEFEKFVDKHYTSEN